MKLSYKTFTLLLGTAILFSACQPKFIPDSWKNQTADENFEEITEPQNTKYEESPDENLCCNTYGKCFNQQGESSDDPRYLKTTYCDQCGNCYDYYGNYVEYQESYYERDRCFNNELVKQVRSWDFCGNAYDAEGNFLYFENRYYNWQACNEDYNECLGPY